MKNIKITLIATTVILFLFAGCDKNHRDRYIGDWDFIIIKKIILNEEVVLEYDTIYYLGKISFGNFENELVFQYTENDIIRASVDKDGNLYSSKTHSYGKFPCGYFEKKNKVYIDLSWYIYAKSDYKCEHHSIVGTKKKGGKK